MSVTTRANPLAPITYSIWFCLLSGGGKKLLLHSSFMDCSELSDDTNRRSPLLWTESRCSLSCRTQNSSFAQKCETIIDFIWSRCFRRLCFSLAPLVLSHFQRRTRERPSVSNKDAKRHQDSNAEHNSTPRGPRTATANFVDGRQLIAAGGDTSYLSTVPASVPSMGRTVGPPPVVFAARGNIRHHLRTVERRSNVRLVGTPQRWGQPH